LADILNQKFRIGAKRRIAHTGYSVDRVLTPRQLVLRQRSSPEIAMPKTYSQDELTNRLTKPGWRRTDASGATTTGTLKDVAVAAHADRAKHPGVVQEVETAIELELLQLQQLWEHLGLPN
jgi:hypothetical protein